MKSKAQKDIEDMRAFVDGFLSSVDESTHKIHKDRIKDLENELVNVHGHLTYMTAKIKSISDSAYSAEELFGLIIDQMDQIRDNIIKCVKQL